MSSGVSDQARHKAACAATEASLSHEISAIESRDIILYAANNKGVDQTARMRTLICAFVVRI